MCPQDLGTAVSGGKRGLNDFLKKRDLGDHVAGHVAVVFVSPAVTTTFKRGG